MFCFLSECRGRNGQILHLILTVRSFFSLDSRTHGNFRQMMLLIAIPGIYGFLGIFRTSQSINCEICNKTSTTILPMR